MVGSARGRAYDARWLRTPRAAVLACTILASSATLRAQDAPLIAQLGAAGPEQVVVQLVLNQEKKGEYFVAVVEGKFLARTQDLRAAGVPVAGARTIVTGGDEYVWIDSIPGVQASFDEARLALNLVADPKLLPVKTIDFWAGRSPQVAYPDNASAFFNYDVGYAGGNGSFRNGFFADNRGRRAVRRFPVSRQFQLRHQRGARDVHPAQYEPHPRQPRDAYAHDRRRHRLCDQCPRQHAADGWLELFEALRHRSLFHPLPPAEPGRNAADRVGSRGVHRRAARTHAAAAGGRVRSSQRDAGHRLSQRRSRDPRRLRPRAARDDVVLLKRALAQARPAGVELQRRQAAAELRHRKRRLRSTRVRRLPSLRRQRLAYAGRAGGGQERARERRAVGHDRARQHGDPYACRVRERAPGQHGWRRARELQLPRPALERIGVRAQGQPRLRQSHDL